MTEGEIWLEGARVTGPRRDFGDIFQEPTLLPWKSVLDNVLFPIREAVFLADRVLVMTARPSRIVADLRLPFARPRDVTVQDTPEFNRICAWLRDQIQAGYARAAQAPVE